MSVKLILNLIEDRFRPLIPKKIWYFLASLKKLIYRENFLEGMGASSKEDPPLYFIIRREPPGAGLFSNLNHVLQGVVVAEQRQLIPVIDMQNYWTSYSLSVPVLGTRNSWEYLFEQPTEHSLKSAYNSGRYLLSKGNRIAEDHWLAQKSLEFALEPEKILELNRILTKYLRFNSFTLWALDFVKSEIDWDSEEILGVALRGTHYLQIEPQGHPKQPDLQEVLKEIERELEKERYRKIFLSCEDSDIRTAVEKRFPQVVIKNFRDAQFFKQFVSKELNLSKRNLEIMTISLGYLIEIILFSECKSCVTSLANGSVVGLALNQGKFLNKKIMWRGVY
jgi:hypothetical protein